MKKTLLFIILCGCTLMASSQSTLRDGVKELYTKMFSSTSNKVTYVDQLSQFLLSEDKKDNLLQGYDQKDRAQISYELALMYYDANAVSDISDIVYPYLIGKIDAENIKRYAQNVKNVDKTTELLNVYLNTYENENSRYSNSVFEVLNDGGIPKDLTYKAPNSYITKIEPFVNYSCQAYKAGYDNVRTDYTVEKVGQDDHDLMEKALQYIERNDKVRLTNYYYKIWPNEDFIDDIILSMETGLNNVSSIVAQNNQKINSDFFSKFLYWCFDGNHIKQAATKAKSNPSKKLVMPTVTTTKNEVTVPIGSPITLDNNNEEYGFIMVDQQPEFQGGLDNLMEFLRQNLKYPAIAQENEVEGRIIVQFVVTKDGSISQSEMNVIKTATSELEYADMLESMADNPKTLAKVSNIRNSVKALEKEAIRVISIMPKWNPGKQKGKPVRVRFTLPVTFRLK